MKKIPTIFLRSEENRSLVTEEKNPECAWVFRGEGVPTRKYDGTAVMVRDGRFYKRRTIKKNATAPEDFEEVDFDPVTGKRFGWIPIDFSLDENAPYAEAYRVPVSYADGTYELIGPKIQGNAEGSSIHRFLRHDCMAWYSKVPREFHSLKEWLRDRDIEGLVFQHQDGRMAKIKKRDFGLERGVK